MAADPKQRPEYAEREAGFSTMSGHPIEAIYGPEDVAGDVEEKVGAPGEYPFTRGPYPSMYRGKLWTMRQFAGFGGSRIAARRKQPPRRFSARR